MQDKNILKSYDVQPFINQDGYVDIELHSTIKTLKQNFINNDFDLNTQYNVERNKSRKFFIYGKLYSKNLNTDTLTVSFKTSNNDSLYSPNINTNVLPSNAKIAYVKPTLLTKNNTFSRNIFNKKCSSYFFQFELKNDININTNNLIIQITGNSMSVIGTPTETVSNSHNPVNNVHSVPLVLYDDEGNYVEYGTNDTVFDENLETVDILNDYPFLYDYHFIRKDFDVVDENNIFFPFKVENKPDGTIVYNNSVQITDTNNFPKFNLLMDFPSFFGLEKATIGVKKTTGINKNQYVLPYNLYDENLFLNSSPWKGVPETVAQWNVFGYAVKEKLRNITLLDTTYGNQLIYNNSQEFYDKNYKYVLSFFKGCNLDVKNPSVISNDYFLQAFLSYNISQNKKFVENTNTSEFISNLIYGGGNYFDSVDIDFQKGENKKLFEIDLTKTSIYKNNETLELNIIKNENVQIKFPETLTINVVAENKKPTVSFENNYKNVDALNQDIDIVVNLDKKYTGLNVVSLKLNKLSGNTTAVSLTDLKVGDSSYNLTNEFQSSGNLQHDYEIIKDTAEIKYGENQAIFKIRVYYSNQYFLPKELSLQISQNSDDLIILDSENIMTIDINPSIVTSWTKYEFPSDPLIGIGIFKTNQSVTNSSEVFKFQLQNKNINDFYKEKSFISKFSYDISCINLGETKIAYDGEYGGEQKEVNPGEVIFTKNITNEFESLEFVLPANKDLVSFVDLNNNTRIKYTKSNYEFRIQNIMPSVENSTSDSDNYNDVIIEATNLYALSVAKSKESSEAWRNILRLNNFFQTESVVPKIITSGLYEIIKGDLKQNELSIIEKAIKMDNKNATLSDFSFNTTPSNPAGLSNIALLIRRNIYALRTRVKNVYFARPKHTDFNSIATKININELNNFNSELGIVNGTADMFGTILLNKTMTNSNATKVVYRIFTNRLDLIYLSVPSQTTFNFFTPEDGADSAIYLKKYFNFEYRILRDTKLPDGTFVYTPNKVNSVQGNTVVALEESALSIGRSGVPNVVEFPSPNFDDPSWIKYVLEGNPEFNPLREIKFSPQTQLQVNSFSDTVDGTKTLPVYTPLEYVNFNF